MQQLKQQLKQIHDENRISEKPYLEHLALLKQRLEQNLMDFVHLQLVELKKEIMNEIPTCPKDIRMSFLEPSSFTMRLKYNAITKEAEQLRNFLQREHTKYGFKNIEHLESAFDSYISNKTN
ncbi:hypothetical protein D3C87_1631760 [compost metagenome]